MGSTIKGQKWIRTVMVSLFATAALVVGTVEGKNSERVEEISNGKERGKPLKIYVMAGQSNMQGQARVSTLPAMAEDLATKELYARIVDETGKPRVFKDVTIAAFTSRGNRGGQPVKYVGPLTNGTGGELDSGTFGPELAFGATMVDHLKEPFLIIKVAWGGKSLYYDFRPPSAAPPPLLDKIRESLGKKGKLDKLEEETSKYQENAGSWYRTMREHVLEVLADPGAYGPAYDPENGYEIAGFVWFQGFNDNHSAPHYHDLLAHFIRDVRNDFKAPQMPFVIGVIGVGGERGGNTALREAMTATAALPEFKGTVVAVPTASFWDEKLEQLEDRKWRSDQAKYNPENKYVELREKLTPLFAERKAAGRIKDSDLRSEQLKEIDARVWDLKFSKEEQVYLEKHSADWGYHYFGSARIYSQIGEALARALIERDAR